MFAEIHHSSQAGLCVFSMLASLQAASRPSLPNTSCKADFGMKHFRFFCMFNNYPLCCVTINTILVYFMQVLNAALQVN